MFYRIPFFLDSVYIVFVIYMYDKSKKKRIHGNDILQLQESGYLGRKGKERWVGGAVIVSGVFYFSEEIPDTNAAKY